MQVGGLLLTFLNHLRAAVAIAARDPHSVIDCLHRTRKFFDSYGLPAGLEPGDAMDIISRGASEIVFTGCLCEQLTNTWTAWDYALETKFGEDYEKRRDTFKEVLVTSLKNKYVAIVHPEDKEAERDINEFLDKQFRAVVASFLHSP